MLIGGLQKTSFIDYPGKMSAIIFTQGCNFRCSYCHNPELVEPACFGKCIPEKEVLDFLEKRKGKLDAVVITGGEPTLHADLLEFIGKIKSMGYLVKLDTNGSNPDVLENAIKSKFIDYVAMDIKAPLHKYRKINNVNTDAAKIQKSISLILSSGIEHEFRTTVLKNHLSREDFGEIGKTIKGAKKYAIQQFVPSKILDSKLKAELYTDAELQQIQKDLKNHVQECIVR